MCRVKYMKQFWKLGKTKNECVCATATDSKSCYSMSLANDHGYHESTKPLKL